MLLLWMLWSLWMLLVLMDDVDDVDVVDTNVVLTEGGVDGIIVDAGVLVDPICAYGCCGYCGCCG